MTINERIIAFCNLGDKITHHLSNGTNDLLQESIDKSSMYNPWFIKDFINFSLKSITFFLQKDKLEKWISEYSLNTDGSSSKKVAVIMAGNIPIVGFHDFLCVLITGNKFIGKLSSKDKFLLPTLAEILIEFDPRFKDYIEFTEDRLPEFDAVIATGSDNTSRYFEYYFGKYPHIIRKNRKSIAIITGDETFEDLEKLADDVFLYFGLGCRNISKIYIPANYDFSLMISAFQKYEFIFRNNKYYNNLEYYKTIMILDKRPFFDEKFFLLKEDTELSSPVAVLNFEKYESVSELKKNIDQKKESLQCIISKNPVFSNAIGFGKAQMPGVSDYADGVDIIDFLKEVSS
jgi:hypothetical protein